MLKLRAFGRPRREDAERFVDEVRADEPELADDLKIVERELNVRPSMN